MSTAAALSSDEPAPDPTERHAIARAAAGIGAYAGAFGGTFGAVSATAGLGVAKTMVLSTIMFTGASQFALVGVIAAGGSGAAALTAALLLGLRNAFYGVPVSHIVRPRGVRRLLTAQLVIDETTAMAVAQESSRAGRRAFWMTGGVLYAAWTTGSLAGCLIGSGIKTSALGLDAAAPAIFLALLWPQLTRDRARPVAAGAMVVVLALVGLVPAGVPIVAAAAVAVAAGLMPERRPDRGEARRG